MKMLPTCVVVPIVALVVAVTALADDGGRAKVGLNPADQAAARAVMIRRADLRPACCWTGGPTKPDLSPLTCSNYHPKQSDLVLTGAAAAVWESGEPDHPLQFISQAIVLQSARMVRLDWQRSTPGYVSCLHSTLVKGWDQAGPVKRIAFPHISPYADAVQVRLKPGVWGEFVAAGRGRTEIQLVAIGPTREFVAAGALRLARILVGRAKA